MIPNIGPLEIAIVLIIALVVFGPKRLPELGKSVGNGLKEFKSSISESNDKPAIETGISETPATTESETSSRKV
ncbi:MAG: twin-arginine translocase TatA/TatE family subunit [Solirubrobacterales bacterium]